jgi:hypothetical protein
MKFNKSKNCSYCNKFFEYYESSCNEDRKKYCSIFCQRNGRPKGYSTKEDGYFKKVIKSDKGCWDWNGHLKDGYGCFRFKGKDTKAHRISWEINFGPIPKGMFVCHKCDNRKCTNPEHLFLGFILDNTKDMISKNRQKGPIGSHNKKSILTELDIPIIRNRLSIGDSIKKIAQDYKVTFQTIFSIKIGKNWKHV